MDLGMIGPAVVLGLGCIGSAIGCGIGGMASHAIMSRVEENHGAFIGMSAAPSSQAVYGIVLTIIMNGRIKAGVLSPGSAIGIALFVGFALLFSAVYQGMCAASAIQASAKQPSILGKSFAAIGIVESFALFAFVFGLLIAYNI